MRSCRYIDLQKQDDSKQIKIMILTQIAEAGDDKGRGASKPLPVVSFGKSAVTEEKKMVEK